MLSETADVSKQHVHDTLQRLVKAGHVSAHYAAGEYGATLYSDSGVPPDGTVDFGTSIEIDKDAVRGPYTWSLTIAPPTAVVEGANDPSGPAMAGDEPEWDWRAAGNKGDPPPGS